MAYILEVDQLTKYYDKVEIFSDVHLLLKEKEKAGLVGANGAGKTTLFNCLSGRDPYYEGSIRLPAHASFGFLEQNQELREEKTLYAAVSEVFSDVYAQQKRIEDLENAIAQAQGKELDSLLIRYGRERDQYESGVAFSSEAQIRRVLSGLGFREDQYQRKVGSFSGGEKTRIGLARILVREYPLLLLDEPTNHLDLDAMEWLEAYLIDYPGAMLIISHDRYFLDKVTETTFDLEDCRLKRYGGNYSIYAGLKEEERKSQARAYEKQQKEIASLEAYVSRYRAGIKSRQARGRQIRLDRMERIDRPKAARGMHMGQSDQNLHAGEKVLNIDGISFSYNHEQLFDSLFGEIRNRQRIALLGPNGCGKTTLLKIIVGLLKPQKGSIFLGPSVRAAYFDQEHQLLDGNRSLVDEIHYSFDLSIEESKSKLARFLFFAEDVNRPIHSLSGGERGRLSLLKLTLDKGNFLILDEPTNHLDIQSREIMEAYLHDFQGTILLVSHDRYFIDSLVEAVWELTPDRLVSYTGNYTDYRERKERQKMLDRLSTDKPAQRANERSTMNANGETVAKPLDRYAKARMRQQLQVLETEITSLEEDELIVAQILSDPGTYAGEKANTVVKDTQEKLYAIRERLEEAYREWEEIGLGLEMD